MGLLYELQVVSFFFLLFLFLLSNISVVNSVCDPKQSFALLHFKNVFSQWNYKYDPDFICDDKFVKKAYHRTSTWNESTDCCSWDGVECDREGKGYVVGLHLSCSFLYGTLHPNSTLFTLSHLKTLNLSSNYLSRSPFSPQFGLLTNLRVLDLSDSSFYGEVPLEISHLSKLVSLRLSYNFHLSFSNVVMNQLVRNLTNLRDFGLAYTNLSDIKPTCFMNFSLSLESLDLSSSYLSGPIPSWIYSLPNLKYLSLSNNQFSSSFMRDFRSNSLQYLDLSYNNLQGQISESIYTQVNLTELRLYSNNLSGVLNLDMLLRISSLTSFDVSNNTQLSIVSTRVFSPMNFITIQMYSMKLKTIPYFLRNQKNLSQLDLSNNQIVGKVPEWFSELGSLSDLDLSHNFLSLGIEVFLAMPNLMSVDLSFNLFSKLPVLMLLPSTMYYFNISNNKVSGNVHPSICQAANLNVLDLSNNRLSGALPSCLSNITDLQILVLKSNNFSGVLPMPQNILFYIASENQFIGEIPHSICLAHGLIVLSLSNNRMSGAITPCLANISSLLVLDLKNNNFSGTIPTFFPKECQLLSLDFNDNQIEGELPQSLLNCKNLKVVDLGKNNITGHFPYWLKDASSLRILILQSNRFYGHINNSFDKDSFSNLRVIDLSHNNFSGSLPSNFFKNLRAIKEVENQKSITHREYQADPYYQVSIVLKGLEQTFERLLLIFKTIDLSSNDFNGEIPKEIGMLKSLVGFNLSHNKLTGGIPTSLSNLNNLEWLDLSSNQLLGSVPPQLVDLTFLSYLNLSQNRLSGPIPKGKQFETFGSSSYFGNLGLCGFPLPKCGEDQKDHKSQQLPEEAEEEGDSLEKGIWVKAVFMGYGCGMVFGIFIGYLVFKCGKPMWLVERVEGRRGQKIQTSKRSCRPRKRND